MRECWDEQVSTDTIVPRGGGEGGERNYYHCQNFHGSCLLIQYGRKIKYKRTVEEELVGVTVPPLPTSPVTTLILELEARLSE